MTSCLLPVMNTGVLSAMWNWKKRIVLTKAYKIGLGAQFGGKYIGYTMSASSACLVTELLVLSGWAFPVLLTVT